MTEYGTINKIELTDNKRIDKKVISQEYESCKKYRL